MGAVTEEKIAAIVEVFRVGKVGVVGAPRPRTVVEVAHRLRSVIGMDQVVVLGAGEVVEVGAPAELARREGGTFQSMLKAQGLA